jgi:hypothetical protein
LADFVDLTYNGASLSGSAYTLSSGSTIITFAEAYLKTLAAGTHTFRAVFKGGTVNLTLKIVAAGGPDDDKDPVIKAPTNNTSTTTNNYYNYGSTPTTGAPTATTTPSATAAEAKDPVASTATKDITPTATPLAATVEPDTGFDPDALFSGGVYISTRALIGIVFGIIALALIALLIVRLTSHKKALAKAATKDLTDA